MLWEKLDNRIKLICPNCGSILHGATKEMIGDIGVCHKCKSEFTIKAPDRETDEIIKYQSSQTKKIWFDLFDKLLKSIYMFAFTFACAIAAIYLGAEKEIIVKVTAFLIIAEMGIIWRPKKQSEKNKYNSESSYPGQVSQQVQTNRKHPAVWLRIKKFVIILWVVVAIFVLWLFATSAREAIIPLIAVSGAVTLICMVIAILSMVVKPFLIICKKITYLSLRGMKKTRNTSIHEESQNEKV